VTHRNIAAKLFSLAGTIELHSEAPDPGFVRLAGAVGIREMVIKWPGGPDSAPAAAFANATVESGPRCWGGLVLDRPVGGINWRALEASVAHGGRFVWMPTIDSLHHRRINGQSEAGAVLLLDARGDLLPEVVDVLRVAGENGMIVGTGHIGPLEAERVAQAARDHDVRTVIANHPPLLGFSLEEIRRLAALGVIIEHCYVPGHPKPFDLGRIVEAIEAVEPDQSVVADFGRFEEEANIADALVAYGVAHDVIQRLAVTNPARVLADA
jgi:hypothetical protein